MSETPTPKTETSSHVGAWLAIGAGLGAALGSAFEDAGVGLAIGTSLGIAFGSGLDAMAEKKAATSSRAGRSPRARPSPPVDEQDLD